MSPCSCTCDFDAAGEAAESARDAAIESLEEANAGFCWRHRIVRSVERKITTLRGQWVAAGADDRTRISAEISRKVRSIASLKRWVEDAISEEASECADAASEAADPYRYRGLDRRDF